MRINRKIPFIIISLFLSISIKSFAHDFEVDGIYYNVLSESDKTVEVTYRGIRYDSYFYEYTGEVSIPETVTYSETTYIVTSIGNEAFRHSDLTEVAIPNSVTSIGDVAFYYCSGLKSVTIPNSVTSIGDEAFAYCDGLTDVNFNAENCTSMGSLSYPVFKYCTNLKTVNIGNLVKSIPHYAFYGCTVLTSVTIPNSVTSIGSSAFTQCSGLTSITIPNSVTEISNGAFVGCSGLTSVTIPNSVTSIGGFAFSGCSGLTEVNITDLSAWCKIGFEDTSSNPLCNAGHLKLNGTEITNLLIPDGITEIKSSAFAYCSGLTSVTIPNSVTSICDYAFYNCSGLTSVTIPNSVTSIYDYAFYNCSGLTSVTIPNSVTSIGGSAFDGCSGLTSVTIPNSVTSIGGSAFSGCSGLTSVTIGNSVTSIGYYAFYNCSGLTSVTIGSGVLSIGTNAFSYYDHNDYSNLDIKKVIWLTNTPPEGYKNVGSKAHYVSNNLYTRLSNVTIYPYLSSIFEVDGIKYVPVSPSERTCDAIDCTYDPTISDINIGKTVSFKGIEMNIKAVKPYTFYDNTNITKATIDSEFNGSIGDYAFAYCNKIDEIILPDGVTSLGGSAFEGCSSLASVEIGSGISSIKEKTFYDCSSLTAITIPANVTSIGNYVFDNCSSLEELTITDRDTELSLGSNGSNPIFSDCPLKTVYIGGNITYPTSSGNGYSPFYRNTSLETVVITDKETEISENEFYGCTALKTVSMGDGVETIGNWAFSGCSSLDSFSFGSGMQTIGTEAFSDCTAMTKLYSKAVVHPTCGSQALDDINKWNCELYVPQASIADYQAAEQWKEFFFIKDIESGVEEVFVDGEDYSNAPIEIFNLSGLKVGDSTENLAPGVYIKRQGRKVEKIAIQ